MAKKKEDSAEEAEKNKSIGSQLRNKKTQRDRNLEVKAEMIEKGEREFPSGIVGGSIRERNLQLKEELKKGKSKEEKEEDDKDEKGKSKGAK